MYLGHHAAQETSYGGTGNKLGLKWKSGMGKPVMLCPFRKGDLVSTGGHGRENLGLHMAEQKH